MSLFLENNPSPIPNNPTINIALLLDIARQAALEAGAAIMEVYASEDFGIHIKSDASPLTKADQAAHTIISRHLAATHLPILSEEGAHSDYQERKNWQWYWMVDPLDGTKEFIKRNGEFTVNIALMYQSKPIGGVIYAPVLDTLYFGAQETGVYKVTAEATASLQAQAQRRSFAEIVALPKTPVVASRSHLSEETKTFIAQFNKVQLSSMGSSLKFMLLAEGKAVIYPRFAPTMEWDTAAAHAMLNALNFGVYQTDLKTELVYNKPNLLNPSFIVF